MFGNAALLPAAERPLLEAEVTAVARVLRDRAPIPVLVKLQWRGTGLLEGRLHWRLREQAEVYFDFVGDELVLSPGERSIEMLLPSVPAHEVHELLSAELAFHTADGVLPLGQHTLATRVPAPWWGVIGVVREGGAFNDRSESLGERLRLERLREGAPGNEDLQTRVVSLRTEDLPRQPQSCCAWDLLVVEAAALGRLRPEQCEALRRWVGGGGRLCLELGPERQRHQQALIQAFGGDNTEGIALRRYGLGRVAICSGAAATADLAPSLRFLWALDAREPPRAKQRYGDQRGPGMLLAMDAGRYESQLANELLLALMPEGVQAVPLPVVALVLGIFIALIGPLDWLLLGLLRRRLLTWALFPLSAAACTLLMLWIAKGYLGSNDHHRRLIVADLGPGGEILRSDRFDLHYRASDGRFVATMAGGLPAVVDQETFADSWRYGYGYGYAGGRSSGGNRAIGQARLRGSIAGGIELQLDLGPSTPLLLRTLRFDAPELADLPLDWDGLPPSANATAPALAARFADHGDAACVLRSSGGGPVHVGGARLADLAFDQEGRRQQSDFAALFAGVGGSSLTAFAPIGGAALRDMAVFDGEGEMLAVLLRRGEELVLLRRIYRKGEP